MLLRFKYYLRKAVYYLFHPIQIIFRFKLRKLENNPTHYSDEEFLKKMFFLKVGYKLDLINPVTFNEKMQWLKLFNKNNQFTTMVDKHAVKEYVSNIIGEKYIAKEYGVFNHFSEIDFSSLPKSFVIKTTHGCGCMLICKDKNQFDFSTYEDRFEKSLCDDYYIHCREWPYKNVPHKIIVEEYLTPDSNHHVLPVYKFFCFHGEPFLVQTIINDKQLNETIDYYDMNWNKLKIKQNYPNCKKSVEKPKNFDEMISVARKLAGNIPFVRVDLYNINGIVYFSEFTFFSDAGFERYHPKKWDNILGEKIHLPIKKGEER